MEVARDVVERSEVAMAEGGAPGAEEGKEDSTLKVVLSALWNLSAHCGKNKASGVYTSTNEGTFHFGTQLGI